MDRRLILYLHGFCSSPASLKASLFAEAMAARGLAERFVCPALSSKPDQAIRQAEAVIAAAPGRVTVIGSSLGGHYATYLAEKHDLRAALINPAVVDQLDASLFIGEHSNFHSGEKFSFSAEDAAVLSSQVVVRPHPERYLLLVETGDEVLDYQHAVQRYQGCRQIVLPGGDHSFTQFPEFIPQLIEFAGL
ncbi:MAG: YqiA/YcfP family alpha/beta fold hydrolase [Betaproteobacteria bacterium]